jgi:hypothetical protein
VAPDEGEICMRRIVSALVASALLGLAPMIGNAAPLTKATTPSVGSPIVLVQGPPQSQGWWEQENRYDDARNKYWQLQRPNSQRYNQLQAQINQLQRQRAQIDARIKAAIDEQHKILGYR